MFRRIAPLLAAALLLSPAAALAQIRPAPTMRVPARPAPAEKPPFAAEIAAFEAKDAIRMPPKGGVLFLGSSSIRMWTDVAHDFPGRTVINRGFGG